LTTPICIGRHYVDANVLYWQNNAGVYQHYWHLLTPFPVNKFQTLVAC